MAKYDVTIRCKVEDEFPCLILSDNAMELGSCWHTLENLMITAESEIQEENKLPEAYSCKAEIYVWTEKTGSKRVEQDGRQIAGATEGGGDG